MAASDLVLAMMRGYASRAKQVAIKFPQLVQFVHRYAASHQGQHPALEAFVTSPEQSLRPVLEALAKDGECELGFEGGELQTITMRKYFMDKIAAAYTEIDENPGRPFPTEESLGLALPQDGITVNITTEFIKWLGAKPRQPIALRLSFPEDITSILVSSDLLDRKLLDYSVMKVHAYLSIGRNSSYVMQKLGEVFKLKDQILQSMIHEIVTRPNAVVDGFKNPTEFNFAFWAHLVSIILKEFKAKSEKLPQEHSYCQASYLIGLYNVYYKGLVQRDQEIETALKGVDGHIASEPFYFTVSDIYAFTDDKGVSLTRRCPRDRIDAFLEEKSTRSKEDLLPEIIRLRTANGREYFVHRTVVARLTLSKMFAAARTYREAYTQEWFQQLGVFKKTPVMVQDEAFLEDLERRVAEDDPLLAVLLSFNLLYLARQGMVIQDEVTARLDRILDLKRQALFPFDEIFGLHRREILAEARLKLPVWKTIPVLRQLLRLLDRMFTGRPEKPEETQRSRRRARGEPEDDATVNLAETEEFFEVEGEESASTKMLPLEDESSAGVRRGGTAAAKGKSGSGLRSLIEPTRPSAVSTNKQRIAAYRKAIEGLKEKLLGKEIPIDARLKELSDKWNPLLVGTAKQNLIEDVNSFIRDQVRQIRRSLLIKAPDLPRVKNLSQQISESGVFKEIKHKDEFREYIQLYLIKVLGKL